MGLEAACSSDGQEALNQFIPKPLDPGHLELIIKKALERDTLIEENRLLQSALAQAHGNQTRAAEALGLQRTYLSRLIKELGVRSGNRDPIRRWHRITTP